MRPRREILPAPKSTTKIPTDLGRAGRQQPPVPVVGRRASVQGTLRAHLLRVGLGGGWQPEPC